MSAAAHPIGATLKARARDALLLESAERAIRALAPEQHAAVRKQYDGAMRRVRVADDLSYDRNVAVAFVLYREAVALLIGAVVAAREGAPPIADLRIGPGFDQIAALVAAERLPAPPPELAEARLTLSAEETLAFDRVATEELLSKRPAVERTIRWLADLVEPRTLGEIRASRVFRLVIVGGVALVALAWLVFRLTRPVNVALHKPVTISERHPQSTAPIDNSGLTNGDIESSYGVHTNHSAAGFAWVVVDLQSSYRIGAVRIYNRNDGYLSDGQPYSLEFSEDGTSYTPVDRRVEPFSSWSPWVYKANGAHARYIRISSANYVALTEVEVNP
jgi:hypothetical protein